MAMLPLVAADLHHQGEPQQAGQGRGQPEPESVVVVVEEPARQ